MQWKPLYIDGREKSPWPTCAHEHMKCAFIDFAYLINEMKKKTLNKRREKEKNSPWLWFTIWIVVNWKWNIDDYGQNMHDFVQKATKTTSQLANTHRHHINIIISSQFTNLPGWSACNLSYMPNNNFLNLFYFAVCLFENNLYFMIAVFIVCHLFIVGQIANFFFECFADDNVFFCWSVQFFK